jgi:hypothetical protein
MCREYDLSLLNICTIFRQEKKVREKDAEPWVSPAITSENIRKLLSCLASEKEEKKTLNIRMIHQTTLNPPTLRNLLHNPRTNPKKMGRKLPDGKLFFFRRLCAHTRSESRFGAEKRSRQAVVRKRNERKLSRSFHNLLKTAMKQKSLWSNCTNLLSPMATGRRRQSSSIFNAARGECKLVKARSRTEHAGINMVNSLPDSLVARSLE